MNVRELILDLKMLDPEQQVIVPPHIAPLIVKPKIVMYLNELSDEDYVDVDIYIKMSNDPGEWKLRASYWVEKGRFYESEPQYASNDEASFEDLDDPVPDDVRCEFFNALPRAFDMIREQLKKRGQ